MKCQRVKMVVGFILPVGRERYGLRTTEAPWKQYAEHDMLEHLKGIDEIPEVYRDTADRWSEECRDISFEWLEEFEKEKEEE